MIIATRPLSRSSLIDILNRSSSLCHLFQAHAQSIVHGLNNDLVFLTKLSQKLSEFGAVRSARDLFFTVQRPDIFLFNVLIKAFSSNGFPSSAISLFAHLRKSSRQKPDRLTYAFAVSAASSLRDSKCGAWLHAHLIVDGFGGDLIVGSALVDFYYKFYKPEYARKVFDGIPERDTVLGNAVISGLARNGSAREAMEVFSGMVGSWVGFDSRSLVVVLPAAAELGDLRVGAGIHGLGVKAGLDDDIYVVTGFVSMYSKCGEVSSARVLFREIRRPDLVSCNAMIGGYTCNSLTDSAIRLFMTLLTSGMRVNWCTIVGLIPVCSPFGHLNLTSLIQGFSLKYGVLSNPSVSTALVTVYLRLNETETARQLFDESPEKSLASWNAMISGYTQNGLTEDAISLFRQMMPVFTPNPTTITSVLSACAQLGTLGLGKWIHCLIKSENLESNMYVKTALVDMYAKCGSVIEARRIFDSMAVKSKVTWNAMITGYGLHGHGNQALDIFSQMSYSGVPMDRVTFLSVLYACSHSGLVQQGEEVFRSMSRDHGFEPSAEHYACMVDIYGRAGGLDKALDFINAMPLQPGAVVWGSLLGACMTHKNTRIAHVASEKLFELDPGNTGYYVLLSNIYSTDRNFPKAASVRQVVKNKKLGKSPGVTLIEVGETTHIFTAGDRSHERSPEIYAMLEKLSGKMNEAGFRTETGNALHDVEEEEKELVSKVHSEKLAIAFGLIATEEGTEIRIVKNLRVCLDCHNATKLISKISVRVIVVRDANRFHHFEDGLCSCGDYW